jgi:hypothetical protein
MASFTPQQVRFQQEGVMNLSKIGNDLTSPYLKARVNEKRDAQQTAMLQQKQKEADAQNLYRTQQQKFQHDESVNTANYRKEVKRQQHEESLAAKANREKLLGIQQDRYNLTKKQYDRTVNLDNADALVASFNASVPIATEQDQYAESNYNQGVAGLKAQAELDKQKLISTPKKDRLDELNSKPHLDMRRDMQHTAEQYKNNPASSVRTPTKEAVTAQEWLKKDTAARIEAAKARHLKGNKVDPELQNKIAAIDNDLATNTTLLKNELFKPTKKLSVSEYGDSVRAKLNAQLQSKYAGTNKKPSNFEITALNKRANELTNNYQAALQAPLAKEEEFNMFKRKEAVKAEYNQVLAKIKNKGKSKGIGNISDALTAQAYLNRVDKSMFTDDDNKEYDDALGKVNAYITQYNIKHPGASKPLVKDRRW